MIHPETVAQLEERYTVHRLWEAENHDALITMCVRGYDFQVPYGVVKLDGSYATALEE